MKNDNLSDDDSQDINDLPLLQEEYKNPTERSYN